MVLAVENKARLFLDEAWQYSERLYFIALGQLGNAHDAEDAVQEILIKAATKSEQFEGRSNIYTWLVRILINHCYDIHRKRKRHKETSVESMNDNENQEFQLKDTRENLQQKIEQEEVSSRLTGMLKVLSPKYREIVILRFFEEMSYADISKVLSVSEGTVKSRLNNAKRIMKKELSLIGIEENSFGL